MNINYLGMGEGGLIVCFNLYLTPLFTLMGGGGGGSWLIVDYIMGIFLKLAYVIPI